MLAFWRRNAEALVPDPGEAHGSNCGHCAAWMAGVLELDAGTYRGILRRWSVAIGVAVTLLPGD